MLSALPEIFGVVLAGGSGTRFWPKSRHLAPKQLCKIAGQPKTMLEMTLERLDGLIAPDKRWIVTHQEQLSNTMALVQKKCDHYISEPQAKNTAAALTLAAFDIQASAHDPENALMVSLHADHFIRDTTAFQKTLLAALDVARTERLCLIGIPPDAPETGYGYIERGPELDDIPGFKVASFREKPDLQTALSFLRQGHFLWNSGLFVWKVKVFLEELEHYMPETFRTLQAAHLDCDRAFFRTPASKLAASYASLANVAVDHGILEKSQRIAVVAAQFSWLDIGSWDALPRAVAPDKDGNLVFGDALAIDSRGSIIETDSYFVAALGVEDLVIAVANGAILVCPKNRCQDVKQIVETLKKNKRSELI